MRKLLLIISVLMVMSGASIAQDDELTPYEIALERIEEARQTGATELDLNIDLEELPPEIGGLKHLEILNLSYNSLASLPPEIGNLSELKSLNLSSNSLSSLPAEFANLTELQELVLTSNLFTRLPAEVVDLDNLRWLYLASNLISSLPTEITHLTNLKELSLHNNQLSSLPPNLDKLQNLCELMLGYNDLQHLPSELGQLTKLADKQCYLSLDGNPLISPPPEVIKQGTPAVLGYLRNQAWWHLQRLIISGATGLGLLSVMILGIRWRMNRTRRKSKRKNDAIS